VVAVDRLLALDDHVLDEAPEAEASPC
jgi:hypothetical protein